MQPHSSLSEPWTEPGLPSFLSIANVKFYLTSLQPLIAVSVNFLRNSNTKQILLHPSDFARLSYTVHSQKSRENTSLNQEWRTRVGMTNLSCLLESSLLNFIESVINLNPLYTSLIHKHKINSLTYSCSIVTTPPHQLRFPGWKAVTLGYAPKWHSDMPQNEKWIRPNITLEYAPNDQIPPCSSWTTKPR